MKRKTHGWDTWKQEYFTHSHAAEYLNISMKELGDLLEATRAKDSMRPPEELVEWEYLTWKDVLLPRLERDCQFAAERGQDAQQDLFENDVVVPKKRAESYSEKEFDFHSAAEFLGIGRSELLKMA